MNFNIFNSLVLAGIIQGIVFGVIVLASQKYRITGTRLLAAFILSFSFDNFQFYLEDAGFITEMELWTVWFVPLQLLSGPLFLLYGLYVIDPSRKIKKSQSWLFVPFAIALLLNSAYKVAFALGYENSGAVSFFDTMEYLLEFTSIAFDIGVLIFLYLRIQSHEEKHDGSERLSWFKTVLLSLFGLSIVWLFVAIADYYFDTEYWYAVYIGMSIVIYWMGHVGIYKFGIEEQRKKIRNYSIEQRVDYEPGKQKNEHIDALEQLLVGQKRFLDPTLTLDKVAEELKISKSHLSRIINAELGIGFPDHLNALRVEEAKSYLGNPQFANYTIVAIGLEAGFNSKTTFNAAFKKQTSVTPSEYRKMHQMSATF